MDLVPLDRVRDNPFQPRTAYAGIEELAATILEMRDVAPDTAGLLQVPPARVVDERGGLVALSGQELEILPQVLGEDVGLWVELGAGHRRLRAFRYLVEEHPEYAAFPVEILQMDDQQMFRAAIVENGPREDLTPVEEARAYADAMARWGETQASMAKKLGISRSALANKVRLLKLPAMALQAVGDGRLSERHGRLLLSYVDLPANVFEAAARAITPVDPPADVRPEAYEVFRYHPWHSRWTLEIDEVGEETVCAVCSAPVSADSVGRACELKSWNTGERGFLCLACYRAIKQWEPLSVNEAETVIKGLIIELSEFLDRATYFDPLEPVEGPGIVQGVCEGCAFRSDKVRQRPCCLSGACFAAKEDAAQTLLANEVKDRVYEQYGFVPATTFGYAPGDFGSGDVPDVAMFECRECFTRQCEHLVLEYDRAVYGAYLYPYEGLQFHLSCDNVQRKAACVKRWVQSDDATGVAEEQKRDAALEEARKRAVQSYKAKCVALLGAELAAGGLGVWGALAGLFGSSRCKSAGTARRAISRGLLERYEYHYGAWNEGDDEREIGRLADGVREMGIEPPGRVDDVRGRFERIREFVELHAADPLTEDQIRGNVANLGRLLEQVDGDEALRAKIERVIGHLGFLGEQAGVVKRVDVSQETEEPSPPAPLPSKSNGRGELEAVARPVRDHG